MHQQADIPGDCAFIDCDGGDSVALVLLESETAGDEDGGEFARAGQSGCGEG
jgi:hypothetical protein